MLEGTVRLYKAIATSFFLFLCTLPSTSGPYLYVPPTPSPPPSLPKKTHFGFILFTLVMKKCFASLSTFTDILAKELSLVYLKYWNGNVKGRQFRIFNFLNYAAALVL